MIYFIINPAAGSGKTKAAIPVIEKIMREHNADYSLIHTRSPDDFVHVAEQIDWNIAKTVACVGGDGTVQEYVCLAVNRGVNFAIIPTGSANDFLYSMPGGCPKFRSHGERTAFYTNKILAGGTMGADVIAVNDEKYFFNIGGTGIDIQVLMDAQPLKKIFGGGAYFLSLIKNAATYRAEKMTLHVDGVAETGKFLVFAIANGAYYGGKMHVAPSARIDDGLITLCKIANMPRLKLMALFPSVKPGRHIRMKQVQIRHCKEVTLEYSGKRILNFDGNLYPFDGPVTYKVLAGAVRLII
jgi:YegS/Rv2252/BmrU family lipid kinase